MKFSRVALACALLGAAMQAHASDYFVVVPVKNRVAATNITVTLNATRLPGAVVGVAFAGVDFKSMLQVQGDAGYNGSGVTFAVASGALPAGLLLDGAGSLAGLPTTPGTSNFTLSAAYKGQSAQRAYSMYTSAGVKNFGAYRAWSDDTYAPNCAVYRAMTRGAYIYQGATGDGVYRVKPDAGAAYDVYCDMTTDGGGWTLAVNQMGAGYTRLMAQNSSLVTPAAAGSHNQMQRIFSKASTFRWTDSAMVRVMQGYTDMPTWYTKMTTQACNVEGSTIDVQFEGGWLNTATAARKVESCTTYPFGMRNNTNFAPFRDVAGFDNNTTHMCWIDENGGDRMFFNSWDSVSPDRSHCTQYNYSFTTASNRGGTMNYLVWVR